MKTPRMHLATLVLLLVAALTFDAHADLLDKLRETSNRITDAVGKLNKSTAGPGQHPAKQDGPPLPDVKPGPQGGGKEANPRTNASTRPARETRDEAAWPILPDGSLYLCASGPEYYQRGGLNGESPKSVLWDSETTRDLFGEVYPLSGPALCLLHAAHGFALSKKLPPHSVEEAIAHTGDYRKARSQFEAHEVAARLRPRFADELARVQLLTNVTSFHWCMGGKYLFGEEAYAVSGMARLWGRNSAFVDQNGKYWKPQRIPVALGVAKQMDAEALQSKNHIVFGVIVKGEIVSRDANIATKVSQQLRQEVDEAGDIDRTSMPRTVLVIHVKSAEAVAIFCPNLGTPGVPRVKQLGSLNVNP